ncbi:MULTISPECIES: ABC transporter ATP-binding protein [Rhodanobacteraceae]|uniref:ABC transporter ATP-binding protein n=1 Tax=Rhodanobacteraceae TaxID=1775411 RepID=UPI0008843539|nr:MULTISPECIES: ABC transporter ATP-binding protein [Rhodanobacteraceae]MDR6640992.1 putative ABC transport system ATP-binding protein [Luteibacter sp. 1214]SDF44351.1 putative ABC transport system ATP-binding protein [Dyella sp. 333MFSha]SKB26833.1 putative ABC transport system ATP-binding protein [Luteibacter sp. 22Crub2.1]
MLKVEGLVKTVPGGRSLFGGLDLSLAPGEFVAVTGESGAGKSTLLNLIAGLDTPDAGKVMIGGVDIASLDDDGRTALRRDRVGFVFQAFHVLPHLDLAHNVALPLALQGREARESLTAADAMLEAVGLGGRGSAYPRELSGGELQRVAVARALVHRPGLILADEPTGNLDPETAARTLTLFVDRVRDAGTAVLLVTHSAVAAAAADRTLVLSQRGLIAHG